MEIKLEESDLSDLFKEELRYIPLTGLYDSLEEFLKDAILTLLAARKDLRLEIACRMFKDGEISIGKACEISGLDIERMKSELFRRGIERKSDESVEEMHKMAEYSMSLARRSER
ncbi:MAG: UPF0175 family protein [bacterium]